MSDKCSWDETAGRCSRGTDGCPEKHASELAAPTGYPAPSWDDFARRVKKEWPQMEPLIRGQEWMNLYAVFKMGYGAALEDVAKLLAQENGEVRHPAPDGND